MSREANQIKAVKLQAQIPTVVAALARIRKGLEPVAPKEGLTIAENFLYMLWGEQPDIISVKALDTALVLHADHELNASTFAGRVTVATLSDIYSGVTSAIGALKGPLHGGANEAVMKMLEEIGTLDAVEPYIQGKLERREKIMGFGHRVYKNGDPRAKHLMKMSYELGTMKNDTTLYDMSVKVEELITGQKGSNRMSTSIRHPSIHSWGLSGSYSLRSSRSAGPRAGLRIFWSSMKTTGLSGRAPNIPACPT